MATILNTKSLYYDDVNLIAQPNSVLKSRKEVPEEKWRIFASPMPSVVGEKFAIEGIKLGLSVILHRFSSIEDNVNIFKKVSESIGPFSKTNQLWGSIGLNDNKRFWALKEAGCNNFLIDTANGFLQTVVDYTEEIYKNLGIYYKNPNISKSYQVMVGNIHSSSGLMLYKHLPDIVLRVGIGSGSQCDTATKATGYGRGQITELKECADSISGILMPPILCADGGIKNGACAAKAFGIGAKAVMLGSYFGLAEEAQNVIDGEYKMWGCASTYNQAKFGEVRRHSEGKVTQLNKNDIRPLKALVDELWGGISSAVSYGGYQTLSTYIGNGIFEIKK